MTAALPKVGDIVRYSGASKHSPWAERREEQTRFIVVETAYYKTGPDQGTCRCMALGDDSPEGAWSNDTIICPPSSLTTVLSASYEPADG